MYFKSIRTTRNLNRKRLWHAKVFELIYELHAITDYLRGREYESRYNNIHYHFNNIHHTSLFKPLEVLKLARICSKILLNIYWSVSSIKVFNKLYKKNIFLNHLLLLKDCFFRNRVRKTRKSDKNVNIVHFNQNSW